MWGSLARGITATVRETAHSAASAAESVGAREVLRRVGEVVAPPLHRDDEDEDEYEDDEDDQDDDDDDDGAHYDDEDEEDEGWEEGGGQPAPPGMTSSTSKTVECRATRATPPQSLRTIAVGRYRWRRMGREMF